MKKRMLWMIAGILTVMMVFGGCAASDDGTDTGEDKEPVEITLGMMPSSDVIPFVMINELNLDEKYDFELNLEVFTSALDRDAAFQAGELDGVLTDYIAVTIYQNAGFDVRITGITDGDFILMAGKDTGITSLYQLAGETIAISENTLIDYSLDYILTESDINIGNVGREVVARIPDRLELLRNGQIDLGLMPEPFATLALNSGAVYLKSANDVGLYPAVSAFSMDALDEKGEAVAQLYQAYNEAVVYINATPISEYEDTVIEAVRYPEEMAGQIELPVFRQSTLPDREALERAISWSVNRLLTRDDLTYEEMIYDVYK